MNIDPGLFALILNNCIKNREMKKIKRDSSHGLANLILIRRE
ncbi:hypothetical protein THF1C08_180051 [Vibrio jasicida]|uniref:Uncharacterized protein n=1 Tax=Vibrio jasicida TaxID=766224 RepID=A0AAU9QLD1_9VIBR|nr:hypothetical protein THF1C08_180051 [Vibrio jasicida]CAH1581458.1 hypothetical protein THF1A12_170051 [Vibrio jasicida]